MLAVAAHVAQVMAAEVELPSPASSSSARSSGSAAHSSSKNSSVVSIAVSCSWAFCSSAPLAGSAVSAEKRSAA